jgi:hypothetical protein
MIASIEPRQDEGAGEAPAELRLAPLPPRVTRRQLLTGAGALTVAGAAPGCVAPPQEPWSDTTFWSDGTGWVDESPGWF